MSNQLLINSVDKYSLLRRDSLRVSRRLDHRNSCSFTLETTADSYIPSEGMDLQVLIDDDIQFAGIIKTIDIERPGIGTDDDTLIRVSVSSDGYGAIPYRRTVSNLYEPPTYANCGDIIAALMTVLADEGIGIGNIQDGAPIELYYVAVKSIGNILDELADQSGYIWYINSVKDLYFIAEDLIITDTRNIDTEDATEGSFHDFIIQSFTRDMTEYANKIFVRGGLQDDGTYLYVDVADTTEIAARASAEGGSGVYGYTLDDSNIVDTTTATALATNELNKRCRIPKTLVFSSRSAFEPQFKLQVRLPAYGQSSLEYFLIEQVDITLENGLLRYTVTANYRNQDDILGQSLPGIKGYFDSILQGGSSGSSTGGGGTVAMRGQAFYNATSFPVGSENDDFRAEYLYNGDDLAVSSDVTLSLDDEESLSFSGIYTLTLPDPVTITDGKFVRKYITTSGTLYITRVDIYLMAESCVLIGTHNGWRIC